MIVLDTNVISEMLKGPTADPWVIAWLRRLDEQPVTTVINKAELLAGVSLLPAGKRRTDLAAAVDDALSDLRVCLPFTGDVPTVYAELVAGRRLSGSPIGTADAFIASIAKVHGAGVATRDVTGFRGTVSIAISSDTNDTGLAVDSRAKPDLMGSAR